MLNRIFRVRLVLAFLVTHETHANLRNCSNYDDQLGNLMVREVARGASGTASRHGFQTARYNCLNRHPENYCHNVA